MPLACLKWITPFEDLKDIKPDLSELKVFGCGAYVYLPVEKQPNKLSPWSELMVFLGYNPGTKEFLFMWPLAALFIGAMAIFDEKWFLCCPHAATPKMTDLGDNPPDEPDDHIHSNREDNGPSDPPLPPSPPSNNGSDESPSEPRVHDNAADAPLPLPPVTPDDFHPWWEDQEEWRQLPRRSGRMQNIPKRPGNTYGENHLPSDIERDIAWDQYWKRSVGQDLDSNWICPQSHKSPKLDWAWHPMRVCLIPIIKKNLIQECKVSTILAIFQK
jgi:hypothetical protein